MVRITDTTDCSLSGNCRRTHLLVFLYASGIRPHHSAHKGFWRQTGAGDLGQQDFSIEKVDNNGFIISADAETLDKLKGMKRLYHRDGNWYEPSSSTATTGDLDKILKIVQGKSRLKSG